MKVAFQFPGQGSQAVGMGASLADAFPEARDVFQQADDLLGFELSRLCWEGPESELRDTENAQPALLVHGTACARVLISGGVRPDMAAGHSLGEFTAHVTAGSLGFGDALELVRVRGRAMAKAGRERPGTMAAVIGLSEAEVDRLCEDCREENEILVPANFNSPGQVVISGSMEAVRRALVEARTRGARKAVELQVSGAFHSPLMASAKSPLAEALAEVEVRRTEIPVLANVDARPVTEPEDVRARLIDQLTGAVRWTQCVEALRDLGARRFVEPGPGNVLTGLLKRIDRSLEGLAAGTAPQVEEVLSS